jgi:hypothetical protein
MTGSRPEGEWIDAKVLPMEHPPARCWDEVDRAARLARDLELTGMEVHFERPALGERVWIEMRRRGHAAGRRLTPSEVLAVAMGEWPERSERSAQRAA